MKIYQNEKNIVPGKNFNLRLSIKDLSGVWKMIGCSDISVFDFLSNIIEEMVHFYTSMDNNNQPEKITEINNKKSLLQYLFEREIFEETIGNWDSLQMMINELSDAKKRKLRSSKKEINETSKYIEYWQKYFDDLYQKYILWAGEGRTLEEEMKHVVSWSEEMLCFSRCVSLKKNVS